MGAVDLACMLMGGGLLCRFLPGVARIRRAFLRSGPDAPLRLDNAVGQTAKVYLAVPGQQTGAGTVALRLRDRTVEYQAVTRRETLPAGAEVVIVGVVAPGTVEVAMPPQQQTTPRTAAPLANRLVAGPARSAYN